jgi:hypothetical protein
VCVCAFVFILKCTDVEDGEGVGAKQMYVVGGRWLVVDFLIITVCRHPIPLRRAGRLLC